MMSNIYTVWRSECMSRKSQFNFNIVCIFVDLFFFFFFNIITLSVPLIAWGDFFFHNLDFYRQTKVKPFTNKGMEASPYPIQYIINKIEMFCWKKCLWFAYLSCTSSISCNPCFGKCFHCTLEVHRWGPLIKFILFCFLLLREKQNAFSLFDWYIYIYIYEKYKPLNIHTTTAQ